MTSASHTDPETPHVFDAFSPRKMLLQAQGVASYILSKWLLILGLALCFGIAGAVYASFKKTNFTAETTFALDEGAAQSAKTEYNQFSEQLGLGTILDAGGVFSTLTNIVELMQSRLLFEKTLRSAVQVNGKSLVLADFFLDSLHYRKKWLKDERYASLQFGASSPASADSLVINNTLRNIYETLLAKNIKIDKKGKGTTIISVTCTSENELFSKYFLETLIQKVISYYIETKIQRAKINVDFLQHRTDSLRMAYSTALYGRAAFSDAHINPVRQIGSVSGEKQQTDLEIARSTYVDLVRSLEAAKTTLLRETPLIQYIDLPILPLTVTGPSPVKSFIIFFLLGMVLTIAVLLMRRLYRHILND